MNKSATAHIRSASSFDILFIISSIVTWSFVTNDESQDCWKLYSKKHALLLFTSQLSRSRLNPDHFSAIRGPAFQSSLESST